MHIHINKPLLIEAIARAGGMYAAKVKWGVSERSLALLLEGRLPRTLATLHRVAEGAKLRVSQLVVDDDLPVAAQRANVFQLFKKGA